jgi:hypothetical protein
LEKIENEIKERKWDNYIFILEGIIGVGCAVAMIKFGALFWYWAPTLIVSVEFIHRCFSLYNLKKAERQNSNDKNL